MKLADKIQKSLIAFAQGTSYTIALPNYYLGMYEMDLMVIKESGYIYEYEIKISRSDFNNDFKKGYSDTHNKHDTIRRGKGKCNRFFFVVPEGLVSIEEVPDHCGLIYYNNTFNIVKNAPLLHKKKFNDWESMCKKLSFRDQINKSKLNQQKHKYSQLKRSYDILKKK